MEFNIFIAQWKAKEDKDGKIQAEPRESKQEKEAERQCRALWQRIWQKTLPQTDERSKDQRVLQSKLQLCAKALLRLLYLSKLIQTITK